MTPDIPLCPRCNKPTKHSPSPGVSWIACVCTSPLGPPQPGCMKARFLNGVQDAIRQQAANEVNAMLRVGVSSDSLDELLDLSTAAATLIRLARRLSVPPVL